MQLIRNPISASFSKIATSPAVAVGEIRKTHYTSNSFVEGSPFGSFDGKGSSNNNRKKKK